MNTPDLAPVALLATLALAPAARAQLVQETFDQGANPDAWTAWDPQYCTIETSGGNPLEYLHLDHTQVGPTTCQYVFVEPRGTRPFAHSGDWRAAGVQQVTVDLDVRQGRFGGIFCVFLASDPGTPADPSDDCFLVLIHPGGAPLGPGWRRYTFDLPTDQLTAAPGWFGEGACVNTPVDTVWNNVLTNVDRMFFVLDASPGAACQNTRWDVALDNIGVSAGDLGSVYCSALPNTTGEGARLAATGSPAVADNDVTLAVDRLPQSSFGYFITSQQSARTPIFSGNICVAGAIRRFSLSVQNSGSAGAIQFSPDLTNLPQGTQFVPGETWNFQYWYRDSGPTANFSEALAIRFE